MNRPAVGAVGNAAESGRGAPPGVSVGWPSRVQKEIFMSGSKFEGTAPIATITVLILGLMLGLGPAPLPAAEEELPLNFNVVAVNMSNVRSQGTGPSADPRQSLEHRGREGQADGGSRVPDRTRPRPRARGYSVRQGVGGLDSRAAEPLLRSAVFAFDSAQPTAGGRSSWRRIAASVSPNRGARRGRSITMCRSSFSISTRKAGVMVSSC